MKHLFHCCFLLLFFSNCNKDNKTEKVEIFMLKSFVVNITSSTNPYIISITNAVLADMPLVANTNIAWYNKTTTTFKLKTDIKPIIKDYSTNKGFAVVVNGQPVYYGMFHPAILSSMTVGVATIDPILFTNNELQIGFVMINGNTSLQQLDKRNDAVLIKSLSASGRLK